MPAPLPATAHPARATQLGASAADKFQTVIGTSEARRSLTRWLGGST